MGRVRSKPSTDARARLTGRAFELFYRQGYPNTGINQILEQSGTYKKTFYAHFESKEELGLYYLRERQRRALTFFDTLLRKHDDYAGLVHAWCAFLRREFRDREYPGCPFANLANQTHDRQSVFQPHIRRGIINWRRIFTRRLLGMSIFGHRPDRKEARRLAERMLTLFEGAAQMTVMTGDRSYFVRLEEDLLEAPVSILGLRGGVGQSGKREQSDG